MRSVLFLFIPIFLFSGCGVSYERGVGDPPWGEVVAREVNALGIRNWIIVAESSFPVVSRRGVRTLVVDAEIPEVVDYVVNELEKSETLLPSFSMARELPFVRNTQAPGVDEFRSLLQESLHGHEVREMENRSLSLLAHSDAASYAVLVLKTKSALPYSSVFIELDSGYWDRESEDRLRRDMKSARAPIPKQ